MAKTTLQIVNQLVEDERLRMKLHQFLIKASHNQVKFTAKEIGKLDKILNEQVEELPIFRFKNLLNMIKFNNGQINTKEVTDLVDLRYYGFFPMTANS